MRRIEIIDSKSNSKRGLEYTKPTLGCTYNLYPLDVDTRQPNDFGIHPIEPITEIVNETTFKTSKELFTIKEIIN